MKTRIAVFAREIITIIAVAAFALLSSAVCKKHAGSDETRRETKPSSDLGFGKPGDLHRYPAQPGLKAEIKDPDSLLLPRIPGESPKIHGLVYYLSFETPYKYTIHESNLSTKEDREVGSFEVTTFYDASMSSDGKYFFYLGFSKSQNDILTIMEYNEEKKSFEVRKAYYVGGVCPWHNRCIYDDLGRRLYLWGSFNIPWPEGTFDDKKPDLPCVLTMDGYLDISSESLKLVRQGLPDLIGVTDDAYYSLNKYRGWDYLCKLEREGETWETVTQVPWNSRRVIVMDRGEICLLIIPGDEEPGFREFVYVLDTKEPDWHVDFSTPHWALPEGYRITDVQAPDGLGLILTKTYLNNDRKNVFSVVDLTTWEISELFTCVTDTETEIIGPVAWVKNLNSINN